MMQDARASSRAAFLLDLYWYVPALLLFLIGALTHLDIPGVYMDAVNPDYLVTRLLGYPVQFPVWALPGSVLFGLFPVIGQIYHGALPYWLGLPVYALFGTGVVGIRIAGALFGSLVLSSTFVVLRTFHVRSYIAASIVAALAFDPGFVFSFRTQFYILVLPLAFLFGGTALVEARRQTPHRRLAVAAGFLVGVAVYGYFIHLFLAPACAAHAFMRWRDRSDRFVLLACWVAGFGLAVSPYAAGLFLVVVATGGWSEFGAFMVRYLGTLNVVESSLTLSDRFANFVRMARWTVLGIGPSAMLLGSASSLSFPLLKEVELLALPALGAGVAFFRPANRAWASFFISLVVGMGVLFLVFGNRLWLTHAAPLLPILYFGLGLALEQVAGRKTGLPIVICTILPLLAGNAIDRKAFFFELERTGGVDLSSNAYERFATDVMRDHRPLHVFTADWGLFIPFAMITRGQVPLTPDFQPELARRTLCEGRDVLVTLVQGKAPDRIPVWIDQVGAGQPRQDTYSQRDGVPVLTILRWSALPPETPVCARR